MPQSRIRLYPGRARDDCLDKDIESKVQLPDLVYCSFSLPNANLIDLNVTCSICLSIITGRFDQIERYGRYIKILNNVGKTCHFYPREAQFGNLCGGEREEAVIVYICDADTDSWNQHLAVFLEVEAEPLIREVGGSGYRQVSSYHIDNDRLMMEMEKIDPAGSSNVTQFPVEKTAVQCLYSEASKWELIVK